MLIERGLAYPDGPRPKIATRQTKRYRISTVTRIDGSSFTVKVPLNGNGTEPWVRND